jgi:hypothetical protein
VTEDAINGFTLSQVTDLINPKKVTYKKYQDALCHNNFINKLIGSKPSFPSKDKKYNYGISLKPNVLSAYDCKALSESIPELKTPRLKHLNNFLLHFDKSQTYKILKDMAEGNCDFSKVYQIDFSCLRKLKFLHSKEN